MTAEKDNKTMQEMTRLNQLEQNRENSSELPRQAKRIDKDSIPVPDDRTEDASSRCATKRDRERKLRR